MPFVALALDEVQPQPVEALVLEADFAVALLERQALTLSAGERFLCFKRPSALRRPTAKRPPHTADSAISCILVSRIKAQFPELSIGPDVEVAELRLPLPGSQPHATAGERMFTIFVSEDALAIDQDFDRIPAQTDYQTNPFIRAHLARHSANGLPVLP